MSWVKRLFGPRQFTGGKMQNTSEAQPKNNQALVPLHKSHLESYLKYYCSLKEPRYAVLVTGEWGAGKTFQVRKALPDDKAFYVSLFGLNSTDDVVAAVYTAMFPRKAWVKKIAGNVGEMSAEVPGLGSLAVNGLTTSLVGAFLREEVSKDKPIIFDDLERCGLIAKETLGIINLYVEHHGCRVIVIAHDDKLANDFGEAKEKIFGQTIRVESQVVAAFDEFCSELATPAQKGFIAEHKGSIINVMSESGVQSLRILRHVVEDLARLAGNLDRKYLSHDQAMADLVRLLCALDIEWRAGRLEAQDLCKRKETEYAHQFRQQLKEGEREEPAIVSGNKRYNSVDLTDTLLQDKVLSQMLVEGRYEKAEIEASLEASPYFLESESSSPWQIVISFDKLDDNIVAEGLARMQDQLSGREVSDSGEMLHIFALRMMMASKGIIDKDIKTVEQECNAYIDDLLRSSRLPPRGFDWRWYDDFETSACGTAYWIEEEYKAEFSSVLRHLLDAQSKALENKFPQLVPDLLTVLETDGQHFYEQVCYTRGGSNKYRSIPILAAIAPNDFVDTWMRSPKPNWYWICAALRDRYEGGSLQNDLQPERNWIIAVLDLLANEADRASGLAKLRIRRATPKIQLPVDGA